MNIIALADSSHRLVLLVYAFYVLVVGVFLASRNNDARRSLPASFIVVSVIVLALLRLPAVFVNAPFNPDEAQYLAAAIKFRGNMNSWMSADMQSSGPLNAYPLMWPFAFGLDTGFAVAHMTALAFLAATWMFLLSALGSAPKNVRILLGGTLILFLGGTRTFELLEFSSELVPCALLMFAAAAVMVAVGEQVSLTRTLVAGFCLGSVPFAKLQAAAIALTIGLMLIGLTFRTDPKPWRTSLLLVVSSCLPAALILTPLAVADGFYDFWTSYFVYAVAYSQSGWDRVAPEGLAPPRLYALVKLLSVRETKYYLAVLGIASGVALIAVRMRAEDRPEGSWRQIISQPEEMRCVLAGLILGAGSLAAAWPARSFPHYAYFVVWPATLFAGCLWAFAQVRGRRSHMIGPPLTVALGILVVGGTAVVATTAPRAYLARFENLNDPGSAFRVVELLPAIHGARGRLLVWGWMSELYVWPGWTPATRDQISYTQIWSSPLRNYYRERMMADLRRDPPDYILDSAVKDGFGVKDPEKEGIASFPELAQFLSENYVSISLAALETSCPQVYASRAVAAEMAKKYVAPVRISASGGSDTSDRAVDSATFETCVNTALLPHGQSGKIALHLGLAKAITAIEILNTPWPFGRNATYPPLRATMRVYDRDVQQMEKTVMVPPYPSRVVVEAAEGIVADRITVEVESLLDGGGGLILIRVRPRVRT
jgi:hypothetical protein